MNMLLKQTDVLGNTFWYYNNVLHREDGPAIEWACGHKEWFCFGSKHRLCGPAVDFADGTGQWWVDGQELDEHPLSIWLKERNLYHKFKRGNLTQEQVIEIKMVFGF